MDLGLLFTEYIQHRKNWTYKYFSKSTYSDKIDFYWVTKCDETKGEKQFSFLTKQCRLISMIPKIDEVADFENFRRLFLYTMEFVDTAPDPFVLETYTLPFRFIELQKQIGDEDDPRDDILKWTVHNDTDVFETIQPKNRVLKNFEHFRKQNTESGLKITRVLKNPLTFRQSVCQVSVYVWINNVSPFEIFIFSEPFLTLYNDPEVLKIKSMFDGKYTYKQVINGFKKDFNRPKLHKELWDDLCTNTSYALLVMITKLCKDNHNSMHLLEFKYLLDAKTVKPWLFDIDSDIKFQPHDSSVSDGAGGNVEMSPSQKSKYVMEYRGKFNNL